MNGQSTRRERGCKYKRQGKQPCEPLYESRDESKTPRHGNQSGAGMLDESETDDALPNADLPPSVRDHLFRSPRKELPPVAEAVVEDDANRQKLEDGAKARAAKGLTTIEKWKKTAEGKGTQ